MAVPREVLKGLDLVDFSRREELREAIFSKNTKVIEEILNWAIANCGSRVWLICKAALHFVNGDESLAYKIASQIKPLRPAF